MFGRFLHGYGRRGIGHGRGRCHKGRPAAGETRSSQA